jgi:[acyl-carrier-protein] S-malonyltransferase
MLTPWLDLPGVSDWIGHASEVAHIDLLTHGTVSDADAIRDTAVAQPLLVAMALLSARAVLGDAPWPRSVDGRVDAVAGHSVGELAAAAISGLLDEDDALRLVSVRGRAMARAAAAAEPTGMSAVVGGDPAQVLARIDELGLVPANVNSSAQVVAAGPLDRLAALAEQPPARARVIPLQVAGAFHTQVMAPAVDALAQAASTAAPHDPATILLGNADGAQVADGADGLARLVAQVARPVRWDLCTDTLAGLGVTGLLEVAPGGVLTGLARRALPGVETLAVKSPADLDAARDLVARHGGPSSPSKLEVQ